MRGPGQGPWLTRSESGPLARPVNQISVFLLKEASLTLPSSLPGSWAHRKFLLIHVLRETTFTVHVVCSGASRHLVSLNSHNTPWEASVILPDSTDEETEAQESDRNHPRCDGAGEWKIWGVLEQNCTYSFSKWVKLKPDALGGRPGIGVFGKSPR